MRFQPSRFSCWIARVNRPIAVPCHGGAGACDAIDRREGRASALPNLAPMNSIGLDTIAGSKLLQLRFGPAGVFQSEQAVMHGERRARFVRVSDGAAIIRYWDEPLSRGGSAREPLAPTGGAAITGLSFCVGDDLANPLAQILWQGREVVAVAQGTQSIHDSVAPVIDAL